MRDTTATAARGGVRGGERALAPDLARGLMLLLIVLSNTAFFLYAAEHGPSGWHPVDGSAADKAVQFAMITGLDLRTYPLFAFLFGYGMTQVMRRQTAAGSGERTAVRLLRRRSLWLIVFGLLHGSLLLAGDILGAYGVASLLLGLLFLRRSETALLVWAGILLVLVAASETASALDVLAAGDAAAQSVQPSATFYASDEGSYFASITTRFSTWLFVALGGGLLGFGFHAVMLLGFWSARKRILEEPQHHLGLLRITAVAGLAIGWLGGLPSALAHVGALDASPAVLAEAGPLYTIQSVTGTAGGLGYVAVFALVAHRLSARARTSAPVTAVAAVGKRSLSCYLAHSLIFAPLLSAWGLGWGAHLTSATMALFAAAVWLVTVAAAHVLDRADRRGPAEALLRRLMYGRPAQGRAHADTVPPPARRAPPDRAE